MYSPLRLKLARYRHIAQLDPHPDWLTPAFQPCIRPRPRLPLGSSAEALVSAARPIAHTKSSFFTSASSEIHPTSVEWDTSVPRPRPCRRKVTRWSYKPLSRSDPVLRFVLPRQRFVRRYQGRDPGHTGIRAGRGPLALRCWNKPHRRAERPSGRSDRGLRFVRSRQRFVRWGHGRMRPNRKKLSF